MVLCSIMSAVFVSSVKFNSPGFHYTLSGSRHNTIFSSSDLLKFMMIGVPLLQKFLNLEYIYIHTQGEVVISSSELRNE